MRARNETHRKRPVYFAFFSLLVLVLIVELDAEAALSQIRMRLIQKRAFSFKLPYVSSILPTQTIPFSNGSKILIYPTSAIMNGGLYYRPACAYEVQKLSEIPDFLPRRFESIQNSERSNSDQAQEFSEIVFFLDKKLWFVNQEGLKIQLPFPFEPYFETSQISYTVKKLKPSLTAIGIWNQVDEDFGSLSTVIVHEDGKMVELDVCDNLLQLPSSDWITTSAEGNFWSPYHLRNASCDSFNLNPPGTTTKETDSNDTKSRCHRDD